MVCFHVIQSAVQFVLVGIQRLCRAVISFLMQTIYTGWRIVFSPMTIQVHLNQARYQATSMTNDKILILDAPNGLQSFWLIYTMRNILECHNDVPLEMAHHQYHARSDIAWKCPTCNHLYYLDFYVTVILCPCINHRSWTSKSQDTYAGIICAQTMRDGITM